MGKQHVRVDVANETRVFFNPEIIFVVGLAGLFTGRSAPMGVIFIVATIGVMAYLGYIDFANPDATWVLLVLSAIMGVFLGKRYS